MSMSATTQSLSQLKGLVKPLAQKAVTVVGGDRSNLQIALKNPEIRPLVIQVAKAVSDSKKSYEASVSQSGGGAAADLAPSPILDLQRVIESLKEGDAPISHEKAVALKEAFSNSVLVIETPSGGGGGTNLIVNFSPEAPRQHAKALAGFDAIAELKVKEDPAPMPKEAFAPRSQAVSLERTADTPTFKSLSRTTNPDLKGSITASFDRFKALGKLTIESTEVPVKDVVLRGLAEHGGKDGDVIAIISRELAEARVDAAAISTVQTALIEVVSTPESLHEAVMQAREAAPSVPVLSLEGREVSSKVERDLTVTDVESDTTPSIRVTPKGKDTIDSARSLLASLHTAGIMPIATERASASASSVPTASAKAVADLKTLVGIEDVTPSDDAQLNVVQEALPDLVQIELATEALKTLSDAQVVREKIYAQVLPEVESLRESKQTEKAQLEPRIAAKQETVVALTEKIDSLTKANSDATPVVVVDGEAPRVPTETDIVTLTEQRHAVSEELATDRASLQSANNILSFSLPDAVNALLTEKLTSDDPSVRTDAAVVKAQLDQANNDVTSVVVSTDNRDADGLVQFAVVGGSGAGGARIDDVDSAVAALENTIGVRSAAVAPAIQALS